MAVPSVCSEKGHHSPQPSTKWVCVSGHVWMSGRGARLKAGWDPWYPCSTTASSTSFTFFIYLLRITPTLKVSVVLLLEQHALHHHLSLFTERLNAAYWGVTPWCNKRPGCSSSNSNVVLKNALVYRDNLQTHSPKQPHSLVVIQTEVGMCHNYALKTSWQCGVTMHFRFESMFNNECSATSEQNTGE